MKKTILNLCLLTICVPYQPLLGGRHIGKRIAITHRYMKKVQVPINNKQVHNKRVRDQELCVKSCKNACAVTTAVAALCVVAMAVQWLLLGSLERS